MCKILEQYADKIKGCFSFFDRIIINGYIKPLMNEHSRIGALYQLGILYKDFKTYFSSVTESISKQIEDSASELGRPVVYLPSAKERKEDIAKRILAESTFDSGLICVLKTLESCKTAKVYGSDDGKLAVKSSQTKCLHYYLYYLDKVYGFMFVKIQTWFPFNIQVYINGRELMKPVFDKNNISYQCYAGYHQLVITCIMYDKCSVLRVETTINNPREFKIHAVVHHYDGTESKEWKPMGKSISNLYRYAEVAKSCNQRFLDSMTDIVPVKSTLDEIDKVCSRKKMDGKTVMDFNVWSPDVVLIMETICDGKYLINGFRNKDIRETIFPDLKDPRKLGSKTSRLIKKLRQHGLVKKVPRSRRYHLTSKGRRIMGTLIELRHREYPPLAAQVA